MDQTYFETYAFVKCENHDELMELSRSCTVGVPYVSDWS